jgi:TRAP-type C4-dicarboxylate transport system permease small subunit
MRKLLHLAIDGAAVLACALLAAMVVVMLAAIVLRQFGILMPGSEEISTFAMVGMAFLGLPYAYRSGAHVRVETLLTRLSERTKARLNIWCVVVSAVICAVFCYFVYGLVRDSYQFGDVSEGLLAIPRWIPQLPILIGLLLLTLALLDDLLILVAVRKASFEQPQADGAAQAE